MFALPVQMEMEAIQDGNDAPPPPPATLLPLPRFNSSLHFHNKKIQGRFSNIYFVVFVKFTPCRTLRNTMHCGRGRHNVSHKIEKVYEKKNI